MDEMMRNVAARTGVRPEDLAQILRIETECLDLDASTDAAVKQIEEYLEESES